MVWNKAKVKRPRKPKLKALGSLKESKALAKQLSKASYFTLPREYTGREGDILIVLELGRRLKLEPIDSLFSIRVMDSKPSIMVNDLLPMMLRTGDFESVDQSNPADARKEREVWCQIKRRGRKRPVRTTLTVDMARDEKLWRRPMRDEDFTVRGRYGYARMQRDCNAICALTAAEDLLIGINVISKFKPMYLHQGAVGNFSKWKP